MITVRRIVISIILAFAIALLAFGFNGARDNTAPKFTDVAVEGTYPNEGDLDLRQARIGIDVKSGYTAELQVDQTPIPDDQVEKVVGLDQYFYTPGPGTETGALAPGRHCATATIRQIGDPNDPGRKFSWCFQSH
jgi:hypothetical protein